jgi:hypothetical protein
MTSFPVTIEPRPEPRLAAAALLLHLSAAALPWATRCPAWLAVLLSLLAIAAFTATLARLPGRHCRLQGLVYGGDSWRVRLAGEACDRPARVGPGTRVHADLIALDLATGRGRLGWLLTREATDSGQFRRLKARLRLAC